MPEIDILKFDLGDITHDFLLATRGPNFYKVRIKGIHVADVSIEGVCFHRTAVILDGNCFTHLASYILELIDYL